MKKYYNTKTLRLSDLSIRGFKVAPPDLIRSKNQNELTKFIRKFLFILT